MLRRVQHGHPGREGATLEHVRWNEAITNVAFGGRRRRVYARIAAQPGDQVLDIGCGGGYLARLLAAAVTPGGRVTRLDPSASAIGYARRRAPANCSFAVAVAQDLRLPDRSFDVVTSTLAAHHISAAARLAAFGEMYGVLRPGGTLLLADFRPSGRRRTLHSLGRAGAMAHRSRSMSWQRGLDSASRPTVTSRCCATSGPSAPTPQLPSYVRKEKAMLTAEAHVQTSHPGRYLVQLSRHAQQVHRLRHRRHSDNEGDAPPSPKVEHSEWSETRGSIDFGWGRCTLQANGDLLTLRAEAADEQHLQRVQDIVTRDIERFGSREHLKVSWQRLDPPISPAGPAS